MIGFDRETFLKLCLPAAVIFVAYGLFVASSTRKELEKVQTSIEKLEPKMEGARNDDSVGKLLQRRMGAVFAGRSRATIYRTLSGLRFTGGVRHGFEMENNILLWHGHTCRR